MLNDATCFKKMFIVTGYTDLRSGIDRLADTVCSYLGEDAIEPVPFIFSVDGEQTVSKVWYGKMTVIFCFIKD